MALTERQRELALALTQRRDELRRSLRSLEPIAVQVLPDAIDQGQSDMERDWHVRTMSATSRLLHAVEDALERLKTGDYGICEHCGEPINPRRLQAVPWAALCLSCQEQADAEPERSESASAA